MADETPKVSKKILAGAGSGVIGFTTVVFAYIDSKIDDVNMRVDDRYNAVQTYVDARHTSVEEKLNTIEKLLVKIDDRIYELTKTKK